MTGPLDGIRIIDLTAMISGPLATMMLADQGAEVIKVENPAGGDFTRSAANRQGDMSALYLNNNRNKPGGNGRCLCAELPTGSHREDGAW